MITNPTPLREELVRWCGYTFDKDRNIWYRDNSKVLLRYWPPTGNETPGWWQGLLWAEQGQENQALCEVDSQGRLILLCLALDGDAYPLIINFPKQ